MMDRGFIGMRAVICALFVLSCCWHVHATDDNNASIIEKLSNEYGLYSPSVRVPGKDEQAAMDLVLTANTTEQRIQAMESLVSLKDSKLREVIDLAKYYFNAFQESDQRSVRLQNIIDSDTKYQETLAERLRNETEFSLKLKELYYQGQENLTAFAKTLDKSREVANDPAFSKWVQRRVENVAQMVDEEDTGKVLGAAVEKAIDGARSSVEYFEKQVEERIPSKVLALFLCVVVFSLPFMVCIYLLKYVTVALSVRQHILLSHLFYFVLSTACIGAWIVTAVDPIANTRNASKVYNFILSLSACTHWVVLVLLMIYSVITGGTWHERQIFLTEVLLFASVCRNVWKRSTPYFDDALATYQYSSISVQSYVLYAFAFGLMIFLTIDASAARKGSLTSTFKGAVSDGMFGAEIAATKILNRLSGRPFSFGFAKKFRRFSRSSDEDLEKQQKWCIAQIRRCL